MAVITHNTSPDAFADPLHSRKRANGPVTRAIQAMHAESEPPRRSILATAAAAIVGVIVGCPNHKGTGPDLSFAAEEWLRDARALGMLVLMQPDGQLWRTIPLHDGSERAKAREAHWVALNRRPRLMRAVYAAAERGFVPEVVS